MSSPPSAETKRDFDIRQLGAMDVAACRALMVMFAQAFEEDGPPYAAAPPSDAYCRELLSQTTNIVLIASRNGAVIGGLIAYELRKFEQERSEIYIYDLAVDARHRRQGVATGLIQHLQVIAVERGAWAVFVQADYGDDAAVSLYSKLGRREDVMHFDIPPKQAR